VKVHCTVTARVLAL